MRTRPLKTPLLGLAVLLGGAVASASAQVVPCEAPARVREALRAVPVGTDLADRPAREAALEALLKRFPDDVYVNRGYQDDAMDTPGATAADRDAILARYRTLAAKHRRDPVFQYLSARAQVGTSTKTVLPLLESLSLGIPPARLDLVRIYRSPAFEDREKALAHLEAFTKSCPNTVAAYDYFRTLEPTAVVKQGAVQLRRILGSRTDRETLKSYSTLWKLEFSITPASGHDALRRQVAKDLERLRTLDPPNDADYYSMLQEGYALTADSDGTKWVMAQQRKLTSRRAQYAVMSAVMGEWSGGHPYPKAGDSADAWKTWREAYEKATAEWVREWPDRTIGWFRRVEALRDADVATLADVEAAGEHLLQAAAKCPAEMGFVSPRGGSSLALMVAELYAAKGVRLDRLPDLVKQGLSERQIQPLDSDLYPRRGEQGNLEYVEWYTALTIADIWLNAADVPRAREAMIRLQTMADRSKPRNVEKDAAKTTAQRANYLSRQSAYWARMGDLARLEGRKVDAITFYQNALLCRPEAPQRAPKDELAEKARATWKDIGGGETAWQAWSNRKDLLAQPVAGTDAPRNWMSTRKALPEFDLADMTGARWQLAKLRGKTTLLNVWAST